MLDLNTISAKELSRLPEKDLKVLLWLARWKATARPKQLPPEGDWTEWGMLSGRGTGKTKSGSQWLGQESYFDTNAFPRFVIAPTLNDVRHTCFEGPTGLLNTIPPEVVKKDGYNRTNLTITLENGALIRGFSAEEPDRLRGPQAAACWLDELAAWTDSQTTWDMMMLGLRLGPHPKVMWTTTPKPKEFIRKLIQPKVGRVIVTESTYENRANLPASFFEQIAQYEGTQLGRQELEGELIDAEEGGVIQRSWIRLWPSKRPLPAFDWIVMSLDTAFTEATTNNKGSDPDYSACSVWGTFFHEERQNVLLLDCWQERLGFPDLVRKVKRELNVAYGDDQDTALIKPMFGSGRPVTSGRKPDILLIEDKGSGISLRQQLDREGISAYAYNPGRTDKLARLHMVSNHFARKQVWAPESDKFPGKPRTWADPLIAQLCSYTGKGSLKHDDFVDVTTQALRLLGDKNLLSAVKVTTDERKRDLDEERERSLRPRRVVNPYAM